MSGSVNKVILVGRLGHDPELKATQGGQSVCNFSVATDESWTDKGTGQKQERTEWHKIVVWGKLADLCGQYLKKGRQAYLEGKLTTREWQDKDGNKRTTTEVVADKVVFIGGGRSEERDDGGQQEQRPGPPPRQPAGGNYGGVPASAQGLGGFGGFGGDDDIPF